MSSHDYQLIVSPQAQQDIIDILRYTGETWGQNQLLIYRDKIDEALNNICQNPLLGHVNSELPQRIACISLVPLLWCTE